MVVGLCPFHTDQSTLSSFKSTDSRRYNGSRTNVFGNVQQSHVQDGSGTWTLGLYNASLLSVESKSGNYVPNVCFLRITYLQRPNPHLAAKMAGCLPPSLSKRQTPSFVPLVVYFRLKEDSLSQVIGLEFLIALNDQDKG